MESFWVRLRISWSKMEEGHCSYAQSILFVILAD